MNVLKLGNNF